MIIPGFIISWITFPGVIMHEFAHATFCRITKTKIHEICYFRFGNPAGYVTHEPPTSIWKHILIGIGPFFINTSLGFLIGVLARLILARLIPSNLVIPRIILWLGVSIAMHSFPSTGDAQSIWHALWKKETSITTKLAGIPLVGLIFLGAMGSVFWLDLMYGIGVVIGIPEIIF